MRRELLETAGYQFSVVPPDAAVECGVCSERGPAGLVAEFAYRKAAVIRDQLRTNPPPTIRDSHSAVILAADTVAECDGIILGKPRDEADARTMLQKLSGRWHRVLTGVCVWPPRAAEPMIRIAVSELRMDELSASQIDDYLATGQWEGKAGAFGYQDRLGWVHVESGSESNVVGLPMDLVADMLAEVAQT